MAVGEIRGQLREVIANVAKMSDKQDRMLDAMSGLSMTPAELSAHKVETAAKIAALDVRVKAIENAKVKTEGALGVVQMVLNSKAFGWIVGGATTVYFLVSGKLHL